MFASPIFIIGKPRSGTKLLANLLANHPSFAILPDELKFLPYYLNNPQLIDDLDSYKNFKRFYYSVRNTDSFVKQAKKGKEISVEK